METYDREISRMEGMVADLRAMRTRVCEPKNKSNPRYHSFSLAVSGLLKVIDDLRVEDEA